MSAFSLTDAYVAWRRRRPPGQTYNISHIDEHLYLAGWPRAEDAPLIIDTGISLIISMFYGIHPRVLNRPPLRLVQYGTVDSPLTPIPIATLQRGVNEAMNAINQGQGVLVHCKHGRHRSVALVACILIAMGNTSEAAMRQVAERRAVADPYAYYICSRIEKFERAWQQGNPRIIDSPDT